MLYQFRAAFDRNDRVLNFPSRSIGNVYLRNPWTSHPKHDVLRPASGTIRVPQGTFVKLDVDTRHEKRHLPFLEVCDPDSLDCLMLCGMDVSDSDLPVVGRLTGLKELHLITTSVTSEGLRSI